MIVWVDAQISPHLAPWLGETFSVQAFSVRYLGLRDAKDRAIFEKAREAQAVVLTKDADFVRLVQELGPPPQIVWITCGNTSNKSLRILLGDLLPDALRLLAQGEAVVELRDATLR